MFPILYESVTAGTVPQHHGLGVLSDAISCEVEQERNGIYELVMEYPLSGIHAEDLAQRRILKVKPNYTDNPQLFRIDRITATMKGTVTCYAKHISYDLSGYAITGGTAINAQACCDLLSDATKTHGASEPPDFDIHTDKQVTALFTVTEPSSVKSWFAGKEGSFLDVYGTAELKYDNFRVDFLLHAGVVEPRTTIRYGKNLLELSQEIDSSKLYSHVLCYYKSSDAVVSGEQVATGLTLDMPKTLIINVTEDYQETPTPQQLTNAAIAYKNTHNLTVPTNNITLDFVQSGTLTEVVDLCDNVSIYYEALGVTRAQAKCIRTKYDCLREKYIETEFGDVKTDLADTITNSTARVNDAVNSANEAVSAAASKKRVFISEPMPPYDKGDLWAEDGVIYLCVHARQNSIIKEAAGSVAEFESLVNTDLIECFCEIEPDAEGVEQVVITVSNGDDNPETRVEKVYDVDLGESLTQGGIFKIYYDYNEFDEYVRMAKLIRTDTTEKAYDISTIEIPETLVGHNEVSCNTGDISVKYYEVGFSHTDWELATDYVDESTLDARIKTASELITGTTGGNVVMHLNNQGMPYELLIIDNDDPTEPVTIDNATKVWRWNIGGLGFANKYDAENYKIALTNDGAINADLITVGTIDAQRVNIQNLTAAMFTGQQIELGGYNNESGVFILRDEDSNIIGQMNKNGLEFFGETVNNVTPSVVFDKSGVTAYSNKDDKANSAIFWTKETNFYMKNGIIENELDLGQMLKFVPFTIKDSNNNITNQGIAVVANT